MGNRYDTVKPNTEELKKDLEKYGMTMEQLSQHLGKEKAYVSALFRKERAERAAIEAVEARMFREKGSYYTEIEAPVKASEGLTEGMGVLMKQEISLLGAMSSSIPKTTEEVTKAIMRIDGFKAGQDRKLDEILKAVRESNGANEVLLRDILQKMKELVTLQAKTLSALERRANI